MKTLHPLIRRKKQNGHRQRKRNRLLHRFRHRHLQQLLLQPPHLLLRRHRRLLLRKLPELHDRQNIPKHSTEHLNTIQHGLISKPEIFPTTAAADTAAVIRETAATVRTDLHITTAPDSPGLRRVRDIRTVNANRARAADTRVAQATREEAADTRAAQATREEAADIRAADRADSTAEGRADSAAADREQVLHRFLK